MFYNKRKNLLKIVMCGEVTQEKRQTKADLTEEARCWARKATPGHVKNYQ